MRYINPKVWRQDCQNLPAFSTVQKILTIYFFQIRYINLKVWRQNNQNLPSKARYINLKVWRQKFENCLGKARYSSFVLVTLIYPA